MDIQGIDCCFSRSVDETRRITEKRIVGDCLEGIGIVIPHGGIAIVDDREFPKVGDLVICCKTDGALTEYIKQVIRIDNEVIVGTRYKDKSRDFTFKAEFISGVVIKVLDNDRNILWKRESSGQKKAKPTPKILPMSFDEFSAEENTIHLKVWEDDFNGNIDVKTDLKIEHRPLKKCPFCGSVANIRFRKVHRDLLRGFFISCENCGCKTTELYEGYSPSFEGNAAKYWSFTDVLNCVVDKWNTRYEVTAND